jgi:hypothetical protein
MTQSVVADCVTFGVIVNPVNVSVSRNISGNNRNRNVEAVPVLDLALVAVIAEEAVVVMIAVLVVVAVTLGINGSRNNRPDRNYRNMMVVGVGVAIERAAISIVPTIIVMNGAETIHFSQLHNLN